MLKKDDCLTLVYMILEIQNKHLKELIKLTKQMKNSERKTQMIEQLRNIAITEEEIFTLLKCYEEMYNNDIRTND